MSAHAERLPWHEFSHRIGLLIGAAIFFHEAMGAPWSRGVFGVAAIPLSALLVLTLAGLWQALGDWREPGRFMLLVGFVAVVSIPAAAVISPTLGQSLIPDGAERSMLSTLAFLKGIPTGPWLVQVMGAMVSFTLFIALLFALLRAGRPWHRGSMLAVALLIAGPAIVFYPTLELALGLVFLGLFLVRQWEPVMLMLPAHIDAVLDDRQRACLMELRQRGSMPPAEAALLARGTEPVRDLLALELATVDAKGGAILPGARLFADNAATGLGASMQWMRRAAWLILGLVYFVLPDFFPGPIDDLIVMAICALSGLSKDRSR